MLYLPTPMLVSETVWSELAHGVGFGNEHIGVDERSEAIQCVYQSIWIMFNCVFVYKDQKHN